MSKGPVLRRSLRAILPRSAVVAAGRAVAVNRRRRLARRLPTAVADFDRAYEAYWRTGVVPPDAEEIVHLAMWASGGVHPRERAAELGVPYQPGRFADFPDDLLRDLDPTAVAAAIKDHGCYVSPVRLAPPIVAALNAVLDEPAEPRGDGLGTLPPARPAPTAPTWWASTTSMEGAPSVRRLLQERRLVDAAGRYLGVEPLVMSLALWRSYAWPHADRRSAQQFHFDSDRSAFVKMFVYLTDVDAAHGPHTYVVGSHRAKPRELLHGDRLTDSEVERHYPRSSWMEIRGEAGTVFFADTQGLHKGGQVHAGQRSLFQVNLGSDRFGIHQAPVGCPDTVPDDLRAAREAAPRFFVQLYGSEDGEAP